jgi:ABC transport system ATP-binding/permease protein
MSTLCTLKNLTLSYPLKTIFKEVNFTLNEGDKIGVLGLNGHGKTSLFKVLAETAKPDSSVPPFVFDKNRDFSLFLVPQELPLHDGITIENYLYEFHPEFKKLKIKLDEINHKLGNGEGDMDKLIDEQGKIYDKLAELGEDRVYNQYINYLKFFGLNNHQLNLKDLSGGEQRKIALSLGLSAPHQIVLWDEPTNHLDLETIEQFEDELNNSSKTFMIISHDRSLLNNVVERIVHIKNGGLHTFKGTYQDYLNFLQEDQKRREQQIDKLTNYERRETAWIRRGAKARRTKSKKRIEDYSILQKEITDLKALAHKKVSLNVKSSGRKTKVLVAAEELGMKFGSKQLFDGLNFEIAKGDKIALIGKNGVGKSSLIKLMMGDLTPTSGKIKRAETLNVGYFSQKRETLKNSMTPWELIGDGIDFVISNDGEKRHVASYLESFLFHTSELKRPIGTFSGGEKNRLQLAEFMKNAQDIWIFDEPTNDLDLETIGVLEEELRNYQGALIIIGHDREFIENITDKCWILHDKKLEKFDGGFTQAKLFYDALVLEEKLASLNADRSAKTPSTPKAGLSFNEKQRLKELETSISTHEEKIASFKEKLGSLNYSNAEQTKEAKKIQYDLNKATEALEKLFEEWSALESRQ